MKDNQVLIYEFWIESVIPEILNALNNRDIGGGVIDAVVNRADRDTMTGGRFNKAYADNHSNYRNCRG